MGGGGGGAGGAVRLEATSSVDVGSNNVSVAGGTGGTCTCSGTSNTDGGAGTNGKIGISAPTINGSTSPTYSSF
jgi:hypothetical protein